MIFEIENGVLKKYIGAPDEETVDVPAGVTAIGRGAFFYSEHLAEIRLPDGVMEIGKSAFAYCEKLAGIRFPEGLTRIGDRAFYGCTGLQAAYLPTGVTSIGTEAFCECTKLAALTLSDGLESIGPAAFCSCMSLTELCIPESVTEIGNSAFFDCIGLQRLILPDRAARGIGMDVFVGCPEITVVKMHPDDAALCRKPGPGYFGRDLERFARYDAFAKAYPYLCLYAMIHYLHSHDETSTAYIRAHLQEVLEESVTWGDLPFLEDITADTGWIKAERIDGLITLALEHGQNETAALLLYYKEEKLGYRDTWARFEL